MLQHSRQKDTLLVRLTGELDHCCAQRVRRDLDTMLTDRSIRTLVLDLSGLSFMDSSGIGVLLGRYRQLRDRGGQLCVQSMGPHIARIFRMSGLGRVIRVLDEKAQEVRS